MAPGKPRANEYPNFVWSRAADGVRLHSDCTVLVGELYLASHCPPWDVPIVRSAFTVRHQHVGCIQVRFLGSSLSFVNFPLYQLDPPGWSPQNIILDPWESGLRAMHPIAVVLLKVSDNVKPHNLVSANSDSLG